MLAKLISCLYGVGQRPGAGYVGPILCREETLTPATPDTSRDQLAPAVDP